MIALLAMLALVRAPSPPSASIRAKVMALYSDLQTPSMRLSVDTSRLPKPIAGPSWATDWRLERDGGPRPGGTEAVTLVWTSKESPTIRRDWIQVRVERQELVPIARGRFLRGDALDTARLSWQWRPTNGQRIVPPHPDSIFRFRTRTGISPGQTILRSQLETLPIFRMGEMVKVRAGNQGASASMEAQALDDGIPGAKTRVKSPWGGTITGITGPDGTVTVH